MGKQIVWMPDPPQGEEMLYKFCDDFNINTYPKELRDKWYKDYQPTYMRIMLAESFDDEIVSNLGVLNEDDVYDEVYYLQEVVDRIVRSYKIDPAQFNVGEINNVPIVDVYKIPEFWIKATAVVVPGCNCNLQIMDDEFANCGYVRVKTKSSREPNGRIWYSVVYNPVKQVNIKYMVKFMSWYHFTPEFNYDLIMEEGIKLSKGNEMYKYPTPRVFLYVTRNIKKLNKPFYNMLCSHSRKIKQKNRTFEGDYVAFEISHDALADYEMYWDPNMWDCVYVEKPIPVGALRQMTEFNFPPY